MEENPTNERAWIGFKKVLQKISGSQARPEADCRTDKISQCKRCGPDQDTASPLDNLVLAATVDQNHVDHMMSRIRHLTGKKILGEQMKQLSKTN